MPSKLTREMVDLLFLKYHIDNEQKAHFEKNVFFL